MSDPDANRAEEAPHLARGEVREADNRRILIVDDNESIHMDFRSILCRRHVEDDLEALDREIFQTEASAAPAKIGFDLKSAMQGEAGAGMVAQACRAGRPYALAFVDMRMPPGWNGVQTIQEIWRHDPRVEVVICTAFSDHSWQALFAELGNPEQLLILKKPFDPVEVMQLAASLTCKWSLARKAERSIDLLTGQNRAILEWVGQPIVALDASGRIALINVSAAEELGGMPADFLGKDFDRTVRGAERPQGVAPGSLGFEAIVDLDGQMVGEDVFVRLDGQRLDVELISSPIESGRGEREGIVLMFAPKLVERGH